MSFLNLRKTKKEEKLEPRKLAVKEAARPAVVASARSFRYDALRRPHISERASDHAAKGVYVFRVSPDATKSQIGAAVAGLYKVTVEKARTVTLHPKRIIVKGKPGVRSGGKKAYVYLKKGEKIEVM